MKKIGILYIEGALPAFEDFGKLPTHLVNKNGMVNGQPAHKSLDGIIIPGGSILESQSITPDLKSEIRKMAGNGSFVLGMCSGFQLLAHKTDIGRKSPCPVEREGLGLLDVTFHPLISTDRVEAEILNESFLTKGMVGDKVTGFHCHTYGEIHGDADPVFFSQIKRSDYKENPRKILSGVKNDEGNVVGTMIHSSLDENPPLTSNILNFIDANDKDQQAISKANKELRNKMRREVGINTRIFSPSRTLQTSQDNPKAIMITSTSSDSGKTFITTGIVGCLRKKGLRVGVLKVGPDIRDIVPSLYLSKEKMQEYSSIKIGNLGWKDLAQVLKDLKQDKYDFIIIEGVMSALTGFLNDKIPFSTIEIAKAGHIPVILVSACNKGGIESAALDMAIHLKKLKKVGVTPVASILNRVYNEEIAKQASIFIEKQTKVEVWDIPKVNLTERGNIPEVEIKFEEFCENALKTVETYLDVDKIVKLGSVPYFDGYMSYEDKIKFFNI